jgi:hypothetical protein
VSKPANSLLTIFGILLAPILLLGCAKEPAYLHSQEERNVCHKIYRVGEWYPKQYTKIPLWLVYKDHIGMHPNDYWGRCKEEIVPIPPITVYPTKDKKGDWKIERIRPRRERDTKEQ